MIFYSIFVILTFLFCSFFCFFSFFFFQAEDGIRDDLVTGVQTCALPIYGRQSVPYSVVAAVDPSLPPPFGPLLPGNATLGENDIVLVNWLAKDSPWDEQTGEQITLAYRSEERRVGKECRSRWAR